MPGRNVQDGELLRNLVTDALPRDLLHELVRTALREVMEAEVSALCGAGLRERSEERQNSRNGYRDRDLETRLGTVALAIPKLRRGSYFPSFLEPRRRWEAAFVNVVAEAYVQGVSTRKVEELIEAMGAKGMGRTEVSRMSATLDEQVREFRERRLEKLYPYVWLDALFIKVREGGRVVSKAALIATGVSETGEREVLGIDVASGEMESCWKRFLERLVARGLSGVQLVISDSHSGLRAAIQAVLVGVSWQRCYVHFLRNALDHLPRKQTDDCLTELRWLYDRHTAEEARRDLAQWLTRWQDKHPKLCAWVEANIDETFAFYRLPREHHKHLKSTNMLERLNQEIKRRTLLVRIFPDEPSCLRLVRALAVEIHEEWVDENRYLDMELLREHLKRLTASQPKAA